jgi:hypothetical protein
MEKMKSEHPSTEMADALEVSASGYADHSHKDQLPRRMEDWRLQAELAPIFEQSRSSYGSPRLHDALRKRGGSVRQEPRGAVAEVLRIEAQAEAAVASHHQEQPAFAGGAELVGQSPGP